MKHDFGRLPVLVKLSAWVFGAPLLTLGAQFIYSDISQAFRLHAFLASPHTGLAVGPFFLLVGASLLWPARPFQS